jgi:hypothetical protein
MILRIGSRGETVAQLQEDLNVVGESLEITGYYDQLTSNSVMRFQQANRLQIDGVVNFATRKLLSVKAGEARRLAASPSATKIPTLQKPEPVLSLTSAEVEILGTLTVCITSFRRGKHLARAIESCVHAGIQKIAVATMEPTEEVMEILGRDWGVQLDVAVIDNDLGCNELWIQSAYRSTTENVIILHDDDFFDARLGQIYAQIIYPQLLKGCGFASWRARCHWDDGRRTEAEYFHGPTRVLSSTSLEDFLLIPKRLSLSPIVSVMKRTVLIHALKEAKKHLVHNDCLLHPGMLLGTETLAYLRHCHAFKHWFYVDEILSYYGCWNGSGTIAAQNTGDLTELWDGYDYARRYFREHRLTELTYEPRIIFTYYDVVPADEDEKRRFSNAMATWSWHFSQGDMLEFAIKPSSMPRNSGELGDHRPVPYIQDIFAYGLRRAMLEDIVVYCNRDILLTTLAPERIHAAVKSADGVAYCGRRAIWPVPGRMYKTFLTAKRDGGIDLLAVTPKWWKEHGPKMPDMFIGREAYDTVFARLAGETCGDHPDWFKHESKAHADDVCGHEDHMSLWQKEKFVNPSQLLNRRLGYQFFAERNDGHYMGLLADPSAKNDTRPRTLPVVSK